MWECISYTFISKGEVNLNVATPESSTGITFTNTRKIGGEQRLDTLEKIFIFRKTS